MTEGLSDQSLSDLARLLAERTHLHFPRERWPDLERGILAAAPAFGYADAASCARRLLSAPLSREGIQILAGELTIGETYFFREKQGLELLSERILPDLAQGRQGTERRLRIWSAGCCTGEEPYSIAIWLDRFFPDLPRWHVTILATDVNPAFLRKAADGIFTEWSFRDTPAWLKENYFQRLHANRFEIVPRIRERVTFSWLNLAEDGYPSLETNTNGLDLIFCRNVLMYFSAANARRVIDRFHRALVNDGWLVVSPTEASSELFSRFSTVPFRHSHFYRKEEKPSVPSLPPFPMETPFDTGTVEQPVPVPPAFPFIPAASAPPAPPEKVTAPPPYEEALALFKQGEYVEAVAKLGTEVDPSPASWALLARIRANLGNLSEALLWAEKALGADKLDAGLHSLRATILQEQGAGAEAAASWKRALYLDPKFVLAHYALAHFALRQGNLEEAERHFDNVLSLLDAYQPDDVLPQSDGLAAGRLREMVKSALSMEKAA